MSSMFEVLLRATMLDPASAQHAAKELEAAGFGSKKLVLQEAAAAMRKQAAKEAKTGGTVTAWQNPPAWLEQYAGEVA